MPGWENESRHVGPGWQPLVTLVHQVLTEKLPGYGVSQIKEKFGGLRYYWMAPEGDVDETKLSYCHGIVGMAEVLSVHICEECGAPGENKPVGSWYRTLCELHRGEAEEKRAERMGYSK
jgi:hypothetical protein